MLRNHDLLKTTFYYFFLPLLLNFFYNARKKYCVRHREKSNLNYFVPTFRSSHLQRPRQRKQNYGAGIKKKLKLKFLKKNLDRKLFKNESNLFAFFHWFFLSVTFRPNLLFLTKTRVSEENYLNMRLWKGKCWTTVLNL